MNIIERGRVFVESLRELAGRTVWDWRRCPYCGQSDTCKNGGYVRRPWAFTGRQVVRVQRHRCGRCRRSYSEQSPWLVRGSWYAREVHRMAVDHWQHVGSSLRRTAEWVRSWLGRQERWGLWRPLEERVEGRERCSLGASTVHRWLDRAGQVAQESVAGQLRGIASSGQMGTDGLWARLRGGGQRVVLALVDSVSGLLWPPVVEEEEERASSWGALFARAQAAGLDLQGLWAVTSDGAQGLLAYLRGTLDWVNQQRCVWHLWRSLGGAIGQAGVKAAAGLVGEAAVQAARGVRKELVALIHAIVDAPSYAQAEEALERLKRHPLGSGVVKKLQEQFDRLLVYLLDCHRGLSRVAPEWLWRDYRLRLSHGRNHGSDERWERAALVWQVYRDFTPAQRRSEHKRHYKHPGQSPLEAAGASPGEISYLDALGV